MSIMRKYSITIALLFAIILGGCNLPTTATPNAEKPDAAYTAAAQTIIAQLTQIASPPAETPEPGKTQAPQPSPTTGPADTAEPPTESALPTETPTATATATPEETAKPTQGPTATTVADDPKNSLGSPTWRDTFKDNTNWPLYDDEHVEMQIKDGYLQMVALKPEKWDSWMLTWPIIKDFYLEVTAEPGKCSGQDRYGLLARAPEATEAYLFGFSCDGEYSLRLWNGERFRYLVEWTPSEYILAGPNQTNRLGLMAEGNSLSLYANGNLLTEVTDNTYKKGGFGVFIGSANTEEFKVQVSEVAYWELP